ncbi:hypothetical protein STEG23_022403, partial [Scotinomys teguina]
LKYSPNCQVVVAHTFNPSTPEAETDLSEGVSVSAARVACSFLLLTARTVARTNDADMSTSRRRSLGPEAERQPSLSSWTRLAL